MARILVVDDEVNLTQLYQTQLEAQGFEVETANDGSEALKIMEKSLPDLLILDIAMPRVDGYTVVTRLRDDPRTSKIPVIIVTARGQMQMFLWQHPNVKAFLEKPIHPAHLVNVASGLLANKKKP